METILNLLPLTAEEETAFRTAAPEAEHIFIPTRRRYAKYHLSPDLIARATVIIGCPRPALMADAISLRWLQTWSAGVDPYLDPGVIPTTPIVTCSVGAYGQAVSEHLLTLCLSLMRFIPQYRDVQRECRWKDYGPNKTLRGSTVLICGTGDIGSSFARLCKLMGARTIGLRRDPSRMAEGFDEIHALSDLETWLPKADVTALVLPYAPETVGLMNGRRIALMKPDAILLNAGRGTAVDCTALAEQMAAGHLWGAGLDVTHPEPLPPEHPLWLIPNALLTPHVAGIYFHMDATLRIVKDIALDNLRRYIAGEPLRNRVN